MTSVPPNATKERASIMSAAVGPKRRTANGAATSTVRPAQTKSRPSSTAPADERLATRISKVWRP